MVVRGSESLLKAIQSGAKKVSESNGISKPQEVQIPENIQGGAAYSVQRQQAGVKSSLVNNSVLEAPKINKRFDFEKSVNSRIIESIETLSVSKEYFNALQSMFTLYALGSLTEGVMRKITNEDLNELKGILNDFKSILDSF